MSVASLLLRCFKAALSVGLGLVSLGCNTRAEALAHAEARDEGAFDAPVPPENGPKLVALQPGVKVVDRPSPKGRPLGELQMGARVARSNEPYSRDECKGGYYAVRPRGFVCADKERVALEATEAIEQKGLPPPPDRTRPLPYRYARTRMENVPVYARAPNPAEQAMSEPDLTKLLKHPPNVEPLGAFANDVPLDDRGVPTGPPVLLATGDGIANERRTTDSYFLFPNESRATYGSSGELKAGALRKGSCVALAGSLVAESAAGPRRFGVTPEGALVPLDRLKPMMGSVRHGIDLEKIGLPVAFVHKLDVHTYDLEPGRAVETDEELERHTAVPLSGKFRTVNGVRYEEAQSGDWLRTQDVVVIVKRHKFPEFVKGQQKWLDISIATQTLTAYEGTKPVYATRISSGRDQLRDPATSASTARGTFRVLRKHLTHSVDSREVQGDFDVSDAPWVMEFEPGFSITGMYWSSNAGEPRGFHDVSLWPIDARRLFLWSDPPLPEGFHSVEAAEGEGTIVYVRP